MSQPFPGAPVPPQVGPGPWQTVGDGTPFVPVPPAPVRRRTGLVVALAVVTAVLVMGVGVLTALLLDSRSTASDLAAAERAEDEQQATDLRDAQRGVDNLGVEATEAEAAAAAASDRAREAEAARGQADEAAAPDTSDYDEYLRLLRSTDLAFRTVDDATLVEIGDVTCDYLDTYGNGDQTLARIVSIGVSSGMTSRQSSEVTSAAIVSLCPQHSLD
ncbi:uncharacterized protein DUF732 [Geodermatophilus normandii]|uniref:Uncharacterized protein DUF732 n=1 Tax=Geodermatophilus normandii TaxID=1137989 RepID=A0A317QJK2_9ACTN|nr:DUF732 domain-containing protein [Geodermatophilus normandii]PWW23512.1 uncharacterized protein DUF732 [Geodermatophilus normandii]